MSVSDVVLAHRAKQLLVERRTRQAIAALWARVDESNVLGSWAEQVPRATSLMRQGMRASAAGSTQFVNLTLAAQGVTPDPRGMVSAEAFAQTASDGRPLGSLMFTPAPYARHLADAGKSPGLSLSDAGKQLAMIVATEVADAGRQAVNASMVADRRVTGYFRQPGPAACARCAVLAGIREPTYEAAAFERHPRCQCTAVPASEHYKANTTAPSAQSYFDRLSPARQEATFGKANAQAIRDGADPAAVINARRGMSKVGFNWTTTEGTSRRGLYGGYHIEPGKVTRRARGDKAPPRLTPAAIYKVSATREEAVALLQKYAYILP